MTGRDRLQAACERASSGFQPVLAWYGLAPESADSLIVSRLEEVSIARAHHPEAAVLLAVPNAFARTGSESEELLRLSEQDPARADQLLTSYSERTLSQIEAAAQVDADGIFYGLAGAEPSKSTPMQYGGLFLELDREALARACEIGLCFLYIEGAGGAYLDFVADLPANAFGWDRAATGAEVAEVRKLRPGALFAEDPDADILLKPLGSQVTFTPKPESREGAYA